MANRSSFSTRWLSRRALACHLAIAVWFPGCLVAGWWQVTVALSGDALGWLYSVEWPVFAVFGGVVWWHLIHDDPNEVGQAALRRARALAAARPGGDPGVSDVVQVDSGEDAELADYNAFLARLAEENRPKTWRRS